MSTAENNQMVTKRTTHVHGSIDKVNCREIIDVIGSIGRERDRFAELSSGSEESSYSRRIDLSLSTLGSRVIKKKRRERPLIFPT
jgi:hypothetical protein